MCRVNNGVTRNTPRSVVVHAEKLLSFCSVYTYSWSSSDGPSSAAVAPGLSPAVPSGEGREQKVTAGRSPRWIPDIVASGPITDSSAEAAKPTLLRLSGGDAGGEGSAEPTLVRDAADDSAERAEEDNKKKLEAIEFAEALERKRVAFVKKKKEDEKRKQAALTPSAALMGAYPMFPAMAAMAAAGMAAGTL